MNCSTAYGIRHRVVRADTASWLHKNAPHTGARYVIVLYNKDLNYKGSTECARSVAVRGAERESPRGRSTCLLGSRACSGSRACEGRVPKACRRKFSAERGCFS